MEKNTIKVLLVDDEPSILEFISYNLRNEGYQVHTASNGNEAIKLAEEILPNMIILDIMMPGLDGVEVCRKLREKPEFTETIILFLTARSEDYSEIAGFDVGADDYVTKPIRPRVLKARIASLLKRKLNGGKESQHLKAGKIFIDIEKRLVEVDGKNIVLPKKEYELICLLASKPGKIFSRDEIYNTIWGSSVLVGERTLDVHVRKLREKIGDEHIKTSKGIGYAIVV